MTDICDIRDYRSREIRELRDRKVREGRDYGVMPTQPEMRAYLQAELSKRPHGVRKLLAEYVFGDAAQQTKVTRMAETDPEKETRRIQADEWTRIIEFFEAEDHGPKTVPLVGYVGAGAVANYFGSGDGELGRVPAPDNATASTVAVEVQGESLGALFEHWLVYYDEVRSPVTPDLIGRLCVVGLEDDKVLVKQIKASKVKGLYHLLSNTEQPILDVAIAWAARVKSMVPR